MRRITTTKVRDEELVANDASNVVRLAPDSEVIQASSASHDPLAADFDSDMVSWGLAAHRPGAGGGSSSGSGQRNGPQGLLSDDELHEIEQRFADGISAVQVIEIFAARSVRFSEASFRKYVQQGLLPRSRRVGRKGKHRGSMGMYPAKTVRRVNAIKRLMGEGYTIEEIQAQFLQFTDVIESLEEGLNDLFSRFASEATSPRYDNQARRDLKREISEARKTADDLMRRIDGLSREVAAPRGDEYRGTGAAGGAEELL